MGFGSKGHVFVKFLGKCTDFKDFKVNAQSLGSMS